MIHGDDRAPSIVAAAENTCRCSATYGGLRRCSILKSLPVAFNRCQGFLPPSPFVACARFQRPKTNTLPDSFAGHGLRATVSRRLCRECRRKEECAVNCMRNINPWCLYPARTPRTMFWVPSAVRGPAEGTVGLMPSPTWAPASPGRCPSGAFLSAEDAYAV